MASIRYIASRPSKPNERPVWRVEWRSAETSLRTSRQFKTEEAAQAFCATVEEWAPPKVSPKEAVTTRVKIDERGCWIWQMAIHDTGYGSIGVGGRYYLAHRFSYEAFVGSIPDGLQIDHLCRVRACVNPMHLEAVTGRENRRRSPINFVGINAAKTECDKGHPFDELNTRLRPNGGRECKECRRNTTRRYRARQAAIEVAA